MARFPNEKHATLQSVSFSNVSPMRWDFIGNLFYFSKLFRGNSHWENGIFTGYGIIHFLRAYRFLLA